jgi:hypothetical protein
MILLDDATPKPDGIFGKDRVTIVAAPRRPPARPAADYSCKWFLGNDAIRRQTRHRMAMAPLAPNKPCNDIVEIKTAR